MSYIKVPKGFAEIINTFGSPTGYDTAEQWKKAKLTRVPVPWYGGMPYAFGDGVVKSVLIHKLLVPNLTNIFKELHNSRIHSLIKGWGGSFVMRNKVNSDDELSTHAFGIAVDVNPWTNQYDCLPNQPAIIVDIFVRHGFHWLGLSTPRDGMHFNYCTGY